MDWNVFGPVFGAIGAILGVAVSFTKLKASFNKEIEDKIRLEVANARTIAEGDLKAVDLKLDSLSKDIFNLERKVDGDIQNVKAIYNSEIRQLADKIESLREDVSKQHQQLVGILTKLVIEK